ncbi:protein kinase [Kitasatospora sp. NBC_00315]|uniref:serine/threonine-protein kinase n=1 Tax=Kitasatospora sp. NBC_00315 TaxID=2975963 RepID=UPI0032540980
MRVGDVLDGRYRLVEQLGRGGFGVVWEAFDRKVGRPVAVKVISEEHAADDREVRRFVTEARTVGNLSHPHIVTLHDLGEVRRGPGPAVHYLVMELVRGRSLADVLREGPPGPEHALRWAGQVCGALDAAHRAGVVHRDIKPENIMITESGEAKVLDFGIARLENHSAGLTSTGSVIGSPHYLSPERWAGAVVDGRADLYALGCVLYQLCSGKRPFDGRSAVSLMYQHLNETPAAPSGASPALAELILRLLAKDPADRPADAAEVRRALAAIAASPAGRLPTAPAASAGTATVPVAVPGQRAVPKPATQEPAVPMPAGPMPAAPEPEELRQRADLAWARGVDGEPAEAVRLLVELLPDFARVLGPADPRTLRTCHDLALWLARSGEPGEAAALLREIVPGTAHDEETAADVARDIVRWERAARRQGAVGAGPGLGVLLGGGPQHD